MPLPGLPQIYTNSQTWDVGTKGGMGGGNSNFSVFNSDASRPSRS